MTTSWLDFSDVKVFDDGVSDASIMKTIIKRQKRDDAFYILDIARLVEKHKTWISKMPRIRPHYAVKCNPDPTVLKILAALKCDFDCASEQEISQVMQNGVSSDRIIFAHPAKSPADITFAQHVGVEKMTADSETELLKIKDLYPNAKIVLRIRSHLEDAPPITPGEKFGCDPDKEAIRLIRLAKDLDLAVHGFSFHAGSPCTDITAYVRGITLCKKLISIAASMGFTEAKLIDIGGGFPGETGTDIDTFAVAINEAIDDIHESINVISEPGRYYVTSILSLAAHLHTKKIVWKKKQPIRMYYVNCGVYNCFIEELLRLKSRHPTSLFNARSNDEKYMSTLWGPTCDAYDCIVGEALLPEFYVGDWLVWKDMGAYTVSLACSFNGMTAPHVYPVIRRTQWQTLLADISLVQQVNGGGRTEQVHITDNAERVEVCEDVENYCSRWESFNA